MNKYWFAYRSIKGKISTTKNQGATMNEEIRTAAEVAKDPTSYGAWTYLWVILLSVLGGVVRVARELLANKIPPKKILLTFIVEALTSAFSGLLTFFFCEAKGVPPMYAAILTGSAGWMGVRALTVIEALYKTLKR